MTTYKTSKERSKIMASIRSSNTRPEQLVRKLLYKNGYRYRLHRKDLPGKPDIVLGRYKVVILVNGCFWHYHGCWNSRLPKNNTAFWQEKIKYNLQKDKRNVEALLELGWRILIIWECALLKPTALNEDELLAKMLNFIHGTAKASSIGEP
jgi:DNA mismatch endonuclease (patch repair protein)